MVEDRLARVEFKIDEIAKAQVSLARLEERVTTIFHRQGKIDNEVSGILNTISAMQKHGAYGSIIERLFWIIVVAAVTYISRSI